jgi:resuscitation-promoting factor RpfB
MCIHQHEGAWPDDTGNGYFGGLQFMLSTWAAHGGLRFGPNPALLPPRTQLTVAYWTWRDDGGSWREWGTAGACGLS